MHSFDILAEAKMRQWEQDLREGRVKKTNGDSAHALNTTESLEKVLFHEIRRTIIKAFMAKGETRKALMKEASDKQVQLELRLERSGYNLVSKILSDEIQATRTKASAAGNDTNLLMSMLKDE